ncbi:MAG: hypothetical protein J6F30_05005 [Cellulosilyticum sp.]|nr:hypothetical protein [Cellulosilyticum sp.]
MKAASVTVTQSAFIWNAIGNLMMSCLSFVFSISITQIQGIEELGIYSIVYAVVNLLYTIGIYNMRTYQVTDRSNQYHFSDYLYTRIVTMIVMGILAIITCIVRKYNGTMCIILFLLLVFNAVEALADVYHGMLQIHGQIAVTGKCRTIRSSVSGVLFVTVLYVSRHLITALASITILNILLFIALDLMAAKKSMEPLGTVNIKKIKQLIYKCTPLFLSAFCSMYYLNASKYAIDKHLGLELQGLFNILYMPTFVLNLCTGFLIQPLLPLLAQKWEERKVKEFKKMVYQVILGIAVFTMIVQVGGYFIGVPILSVLYSVDLGNYKMEFLILLLAGGLMAMANILQIGLTVIREQGKILASNIVGCLFMLGVSDWAVKQKGFDGAIWINVYLGGLLVIILYMIFCKTTNKKEI